MSKILCIYHANCADGLGAAWVVRRALGDNVEFYAASYGDEPPYQRSDPLADNYGALTGEHLITYPGLQGRDILIIGFSYPLTVSRAMAAVARSVLILDHRKTAQDELRQIYEPLMQAHFPNWKSWIYDYVENVRPPRLAAVFDLNRSDAGLTWDYLLPGTPRPRIIDLIEDYARNNPCA